MNQSRLGLIRELGFVGAPSKPVRWLRGQKDSMKQLAIAMSLALAGCFSSGVSSRFGCVERRTR